MVIKLNGAGLSALAVDQSNPSGKDAEVDPLADKFVPLEIRPGLMSGNGAEADSLTPRFQLEERLESLLARSLNLVVSKAIERKTREYAETSHPNIIASGLSRRPSEFYPEAA
ncbi:MAG: hypothetical protein FJ398_06315 [Verrucomicrobia bacterium]|nr:hypothetical protein [Verrucomicrobiota bacterium]